MSATDLSTKSYDLQVPLNICLNQNREKCNRRWLEIHQIIVATPRSISKKYNLICQTKKKKKKKDSVIYENRATEQNLHAQYKICDSKNSYSTSL